MVIKRKIIWYLNIVQNNPLQQDNIPSLIDQPQVAANPIANDSVTVESIPQNNSEPWFVPQQPVTLVEPAAANIPALPVPPVVPIEPTGLSNDTPSPKPKKRKLLLIGALIVGVSIVLGGSSAAAFTFWYQNPDKVLGDAFVQAIRSKTVTYTVQSLIERAPWLKASVMA